MNFTGTPQYSEPLKSGGELIVMKSSWQIGYYYAAPDFRHNGEFIYVNNNDIDKYIEGFKFNFQKYEEYKKVLPEDGNFTTKGLCNMHIGVGKYSNGVNIGQFYNHLSKGVFPIKTRDDLNEVINDYEYSKSRAKEIQELIFK